MDTPLSDNAEHVFSGASPALAQTEPVESAAALAAKKKISANGVVAKLPKIFEAIRYGNTKVISDQTQLLAAELQLSFPEVAKRLEKLVVTQPVSLNQQIKRPEGMLKLSDPLHSFAEMTLEDAIRAECNEIVLEYEKRRLLRAAKLAPRNKLLLSGPPGNGKTMLANAFARELQLPFLKVRYGGVIDSHLGDTGKRLEQVMEYAKLSPCVLFFDEFDGISGVRGNGDVGEMRRVTNLLLMLMDEVPDDMVMVCATNDVSSIDPAAIRRFDAHLALLKPTPAKALACARAELNPSLTPGVDLSHLAERVIARESRSMSYIAQLCRKIRRDQIIYGGKNIDVLLEWEPST